MISFQYVDFMDETLNDDQSPKGRPENNIVDIGFRVNEHPPSGRQSPVNMIMPAMGGCSVISDLCFATFFEAIDQGTGINPAPA